MNTQGMAGIVKGDRSREPIPTAATRPAQVKVEVEDLRSPDSEALDSLSAPVRACAPAGAVLLRVTRQSYEGEECFHLELQDDTALRATVTPQDLRNQRRPQLDLAGIATAGTWQQGLNALRSWSDTKITLRQWLTALRRQHGRNLRLVVWDETDFQIPWELFFHETDDPDDHGWLGADVELIRWTNVYSETPIDWSTGGASICKGPVLSYIDKDFKNLDDRFKALPHDKADTMSELLSKLNAKDRRFGLVHFWGHGTAAADGAQATLGGLSMDLLGRHRMHALRAADTLVLLNACSSALLMNDDRFRERATRTFAEIFLRRGARGVIATAGEVGKPDSLEFLDRLLAAARDQAVSVSALLRDYRATLARELPDDLSTADPILLKAFIYGCMYHYIGRLDTALYMSPQGGTS
ncbi:CHAT domain-containing protein [Actinoplanes sp. NPDC049802]|uniref:CHAT domain-containing protein n=1 Tax=Actinoplanes sp. NPDC049802 TaxID=3154742 RepID=UPI00340BDB09